MQLPTCRRTRLETPSTWHGVGPNIRRSPVADKILNMKLDCNGMYTLYMHTYTHYLDIYIYIYIYRNCILVWELLFKPAQVGLLDDPLTSALLGEGLERGFPCSMAAWGLLQNSLNRPRTPGARHSHTWHHKILAGVMQFDSTVQRPPSNFTVFAMSVQPANGDQMRCTNRIKSHQGTWWLGTQVEFEP